MNNEKSQEIIGRYFKAVQKLIDTGRYKTLYDFAYAYDIDRSTIYNSMKNHGSNRFQIEWIALLAERDEISLKWLFLNEGPMKKAPSKTLSLIHE